MRADEYKILSNEGNGEYREKGSKFIAFSYIFEDLDQLDKILLSLKKQHPKSRHFCYAYRLSPKSNQYRINDDGEPRGTAGLPIYNQILSNECYNILVVVVRYFGGTKLGASGLTKAYKTAAELCMNDSEMRIKYDTTDCMIEYDFRYSGTLQDILKTLSISIIDNEYTIPPKMRVELRASESDLQIRKVKANLLSRPLEDIDEETEISDISFEYQ